MLLGVVPADFHDFFASSTSVAGALIGLLFVAISVRPAEVARSADIIGRLRPTAALSALLDALLVSMFALLPRARFGEIAAVLGGLGLLSTLMLLALLARSARGARSRRAASALLVVAQGGAYATQLLSGIRLAIDVDDVGQVDLQAILVAVFFVFGIARAWEFIGAEHPGLLRAFTRAARSPSGNDADTR